MIIVNNCLIPNNCHIRKTDFFKIKFFCRVGTIHRFQKFHISSLSIENQTQMALGCDNIAKFPIVF